MQGSHHHDLDHDVPRCEVLGESWGGRSYVLSIRSSVLVLLDMSWCVVGRMNNFQHVQNILHDFQSRSQVLGVSGQFVAVSGMS